MDASPTVHSRSQIANRKSPIPNRKSQIVIRIVAFEAGLGVVAVALSVMLGIPLASQFRFTVPSVTIGFVATVTMVGAMFVLTTASWSAASELLVRVRELLRAVLGSAGVAELGAVALAAGIGEELLFRGVMQSGLIMVIGPVAAIAVTSVVFGIAHAITPLYAGIAVVVSVYLGWLMLAANSIVPPIIAHVMYDWIALVYLVRFDPQR